jgi:hypothetical protein
VAAAIMTQTQTVKRSQLYRALPGHTPRSRADRYKRVHLYISKLADAVGAQLRETLLYLRKTAPDLSGQDLQEQAAKSFSEVELSQAMKEIVCIWIYLEAIDQGGETMPQWLMAYLKLALYATDYLVAQPQAQMIMQSYGGYALTDDLIRAACQNIGGYLGFAASSKQLAPFLSGLFDDSRRRRQSLLKLSLTQNLLES